MVWECHFQPHIVAMFVCLFVFSFKRVLFHMLLSKVRVVLGLEYVEDRRNGVLVVLEVDCYVVQLCCILMLLF